MIFYTKKLPKDIIKGNDFLSSKTIEFVSKITTFLGSILFFLKNSTQFSLNFLSLILADPLAKSVFVAIAILLFYLYLEMPFFGVFFSKKSRIKIALFSFLLSFAGIGFLASKMNKSVKSDVVKNTIFFEKITQK